MHAARHAAFPARGNCPMQKPIQMVFIPQAAACMLPTARPETDTHDLAAHDRKANIKSTPNDPPAQRPRGQNPSPKPHSNPPGNTITNQPITNPLIRPPRPRHVPGQPRTQPQPNQPTLAQCPPNHPRRDHQFIPKNRATSGQPSDGPARHAQPPLARRV
jgi:hypothetical protein